MKNSDFVYVLNFSFLTKAGTHTRKRGKDWEGDKHLLDIDEIEFIMGL
jgi:hypothetical protein